MTTIRDVLRIVASVGAGLGVAYGIGKVVSNDWRKRKALAVLAGAGAGAGVGYVGNIIGKAVQNWKDTELGVFKNLRKLPNVYNYPLNHKDIVVY